MVYHKVVGVSTCDDDVSALYMCACVCVCVYGERYRLSKYLSGIIEYYML